MILILSGTLLLNRVDWDTELGLASSEESSRYRCGEGRMDELYHEADSRKEADIPATAQVEWLSKTVSYADRWAIWRSLVAEVAALQARFP